MIPKITYDSVSLRFARGAMADLRRLAEYLKGNGQLEQGRSLDSCLESEELEFLNLLRCRECLNLFGESEGRETQIDYWCCHDCADQIDPPKEGYSCKDTEKI